MTMWEQGMDLQEELVSLRRALHECPETGLVLKQTNALIAQQLSSLGIPFTVNEGETGIIAVIEGEKPGGTVVLRADTDALPVTEATGLPFASKNVGCMHACGHDAHAAMLLGAAKLLVRNRESLCGRVRLIFQTGEEIMQGAKEMIKNGARQEADAIFGLHIGSLQGAVLPSGTWTVSDGCCMASIDVFRITVKGEGCHGSAPQMGIDPINIAAHIVIALQTILAREIAAADGVSLTVGKIAGGTQCNIIPHEVVVEGTIRTLKAETRAFVSRRLREIAQGEAALFGGEAEVSIDFGPPPLVNDAGAAALAARVLAGKKGVREVITRPEFPNMGSEDFSYYLEQVPGAFLFLSSANREKHTDIPHHSPYFNIDEDVLWQGSAGLACVAAAYLQEHAG